MINGWWEDLDFEIQAGGPWLRAIDTALPAPEDIAEPAKEVALKDRNYRVRARSVVVLVQP